MPRPFSTALVFVLLGATTVAFVVTERLKLEPSPVTAVNATKVFSPTCECETNFASIRFRLRKANRMTLSIVDGNRKHVRTLVGPVGRTRGVVRATWDGRFESGAVVPDGAYRARVDLGYRTIYMPNRIRVDTTPPVVRLRDVGPRILEPGEPLKVRYLLDEPAQVSVFMNGRRVLLGSSLRLRWKVEGPVRARPGKYRVTVTARDVAGNLSDATRPVVVIVPLRVLTPRVTARAGSRFTVGVRTDGRRAYFWRLGRQGAYASARLLRIRAPKQPGRYRLVIRQDRIAHLVTVVVTR